MRCKRLKLHRAPLVAIQGLEASLQVARVLDLLTGGQRREGGDAQVDADFAVAVF